MAMNCFILQKRNLKRGLSVDKEEPSTSSAGAGAGAGGKKKKAATSPKPPDKKVCSLSLP